MDILKDYRKISKAEGKKEFSFMPDNMALNEGEFTESLLKYGEENRLDLVITKPGMYPRFEIDGIEYEARREFGRFGAVILCKTTQPGLLESQYADVAPERRAPLKTAYWAVTYFAVPALLLVYLLATTKNILLAVLLDLAFIAALRFSFRFFRLK